MQPVCCIYAQNYVSGWSGNIVRVLQFLQFSYWVKQGWIYRIPPPPTHSSLQHTVLNPSLVHAAPCTPPSLDIPTFLSSPPHCNPVKANSSPIHRSTLYSHLASSHPEAHCTLPYNAVPCTTTSSPLQCSTMYCHILTITMQYYVLPPPHPYHAVQCTPTFSPLPCRSMYSHLLTPTIVHVRMRMNNRNF